jgi:hypothetical protein
MPTISAGIQVESREPAGVHEFFSQSIAGAMAGRGAGLEQLDWQVRTERGEIYVMGTPTADCERPTALCREWATALGLAEQQYDEDEAISSWFAYESPWLVEVVTRTL